MGRGILVRCGLLDVDNRRSVVCFCFIGQDGRFKRSSSKFGSFRAQKSPPRGVNISVIKLATQEKANKWVT